MRHDEQLPMGKWFLLSGVIFALAFAIVASTAFPPMAVADGMKVFIDPETGKLREPTREEIQTLKAQPPASRATPEKGMPKTPQITGPGGGVGMRLDERYMVHSVAKKNPDGSVSMECITGSEKAAKAVSKEPAVAPAGKEDRHDR